MKRLITVFLMLSMLIFAAFAEETDNDKYNAILQREEAIRLEIQIAELGIQLAQVKNDDIALAVSQLQLTNLYAELDKLALSKEALAVETLRVIRENQLVLTSEEETLKGQIALLTSALETNAAAQAESQAKYDACMAQNAVKGSAKGFTSEVKVSLLRDENGAIYELIIDAARETPFFGVRCGEDDSFRQQFIGKTGPFVIGNGVDALAGATVTSRAVVEAINSVMTGEASSTEETPAVEPAEAVYTASAKGLLSDVYVTVTINEYGIITDVVVDASGETTAIAKPCTEPAFLNQFIGRSGPFGEDVDVVAGATFTSQAVINAVNAAVKDTFGAATEPPAVEPAEAVYTASAKGLLSDVYVTVTINEYGIITDVVVDCSGETTAIAKPCTEPAFLNQFIGRNGPFIIGENVDVCTGATVTSQAVINAVNSLIP